MIMATISQAILSRHISVLVVPRNVLLSCTCRRRIRTVAFSSWQYPEIPWRRVSEEDIKKAKTLVLLQKQRDDLTKAVQTVIRAHLKEEFPATFALTSSRHIWKNFRTKELNERARILLALNGFERVPLPKPMDMLMLAEGVVAFPNFYSRLSRSKEQVKFALFAQPIVEESRSVQEDKMYPTIVQEDIQLYRVLENQAEQIINAIYNILQRGTKRFIQRPIELLSQQIEQILTLIRTKLSVVQANADLESAPHPNIRLPSMVDQSATKSKENLLVMGEGRTELTLFAHMSPSVRLVALPYILGQKSASTLVSVSLVAFGAIPLAYRSLNYAFLYPGLSEALAASVIGTITYGIWSQRYNARISQSHVVTKALLHRVQARDDAVVLILQEGAVRQVSQAVLAEYFDRLDMTTLVQKRLRRNVDDEFLAQLTKIPPAPASLISGRGSDLQLVDPLDLAIRLGLLEVVGKKTLLQGQEKEVKLKAVTLEEAAGRVQSAVLVEPLSIGMV